MKKAIFFLSILLVFNSCGNGTSEKTMIVSGNVKGLKKGTLYLQHIPDSVLVVVDSLKVDGDGSFSFQTEVEESDIFYLYLNKKDNNSINDRITFFGEPGNINIATSWNTFDTNAEIHGSALNDRYEEYRTMMSQFNKRNLELLQTSINSNNELDSLQLDSIQELSKRNVQKGYAFALNFALNNLDSPLAPYIAVNEVADANIKYLDSIYKALPQEIAQSKYGVRLKKHLDQLAN